uniref:transposase n=1 Tax=Orrella sp. TaxID=1921583 RepID=UPI0040480EE7
MSKSTSNVVEFADPSIEKDLFTELIRRGAQQLLNQAVEIELEERMAELLERRLPDGRQAVVRNGYHPERQVQTGIGPVTVQIPKIRARDGKPVVFRSALVPPYVRKSRSLEAALPWLYLKGVSSGEMSAALATLVGPEATGLSASTVSRLKKDWGNDYDQWCKRRLDKDQ